MSIASSSLIPRPFILLWTAWVQGYCFLWPCVIYAIQSTWLSVVPSILEPLRLSRTDNTQMKWDCSGLTHHTLHESLWILYCKAKNRSFSVTGSIPHLIDPCGKKMASWIQLYKQWNASSRMEMQALVHLNIFRSQRVEAWRTHWVWVAVYVVAC